MKFLSSNNFFIFKSNREVIIKKVYTLLIALLAIVLLGTFTPLQASAEDFQSNQVLPSENTDISFNLENGQGQEKQVVLEDGTIATIGIVPVNNHASRLVNYELNGGSETWKVYWYIGVLNSEYWLDLNNYRIVRAYDYRSTAVGISIYNQSLEYGSTWSTYRCDFNGVFSGSRILHGDISGHVLTTSIVGF